MEPTGLNGNEPSRYDFGMNMGLQLELGQYLGLIMRYNIIEEKEEEVYWKYVHKWPFFWTNSKIIIKKNFYFYIIC